MLMDMCNYEKLYAEACIEYVNEGRGTVHDFCRINNLSYEHEAYFNKELEKTTKRVNKA